MAYIAAAQLVVILVLVALLVLEHRRSGDTLSEVLQRNAAEQHTLLNRIQRPEMVPVSQAHPAGEVVPTRPPKDVAELAKIGGVAPQRPVNHG